MNIRYTFTIPASSDIPGRFSGGDRVVVLVESGNPPGDVEFPIAISKLLADFYDIDERLIVVGE